MSTIQYKLSVQNKAISNEEGAFFKAIPFKIIIQDSVYDVTFKKGDQHVVVHQILLNDKVIVELTHPDYVPACKVEELDSFLNLEHASTLFYALIHLEVANHKEYKTALFADDKDIFDFEVIQESYFS